MSLAGPAMTAPWRPSSKREAVSVTALTLFPREFGNASEISHSFGLSAEHFSSWGLVLSHLPLVCRIPPGAEVPALEGAKADEPIPGAEGASGSTRQRKGGKKDRQEDKQAPSAGGKKEM